LRKIASIYRVKLNWLILGEGEPFVEGELRNPHARAK
jgi:hypothetical protein